MEVSLIYFSKVALKHETEFLQMNRMLFIYHSQPLTDYTAEKYTP